jgi:hypothetical protein
MQSGSCVWGSSSQTGAAAVERPADDEEEHDEKQSESYELSPAKETFDSGFLVVTKQWTANHGVGKFHSVGHIGAFGLLASNADLIAKSNHLLSLFVFSLSILQKTSFVGLANL